MVVIVAELAFAVLSLGHLGILQPIDHSVFRHQLFDVMRGAMLGDHHQVIFIARICDARHRSHLGIAQFASGQTLVDLWQRGQCPGHPHFFPGRVGINAAFEIEPVRAVSKAQISPAFFFIEFANQGE